MTQVKVCKVFTFDAAHQLVGHQGKCANLHGHTYKLEVVAAGAPQGPDHPAEEGFVIDFGDLKQAVHALILSRFDHAFLAMGTEPALPALMATGSKVVRLGFRTTAENLAMYVCHRLRTAGLPVYAVRLWETPTSWAEVLAADIPPQGPTYRTVGGCDVDEDGD
ncbi:6-carboxytetrahydropterin synthase QueD [Alicyclobacillus cellulosilyticus]|uniref:6-carboxy-5,6,7,8-tetrahydropterin synthase n=1 Tax=Alicyclobacillus cellulosilyticus TaxID=1003997 RepID=A0A917NJY6_9BACL|nr:6-carboxytetrahydropterin synthase [Alicyclobacillus cellulosilyticus]GGJ06335.1 6-carboxytetrahydropterin synthase QueD [Alicyclobacillus cellulosilyticus]